MPMPCTWITARLISACVGAKHPFYKMCYTKWCSGAKPLCKEFEICFWLGFSLIAAGVAIAIYHRV